MASWRTMHRRQKRSKLFCEFEFRPYKLWDDDPGYSLTRKQCGEPSDVECQYHFWEEPVNRYCCEHAELKGFCQACGLFCAGIDSFEFRRPYGYCDNCRDEIEADFYAGEYDYWDGGSWDEAEWEEDDFDFEEEEV